MNRIVNKFSGLFLSLAVCLTLVQAHGISVHEPNVEFLKAHGVGSYNYICKNKKYEFSDSNGELQVLHDRSVSLGTFTFYNTGTGIGSLFNFNAKSPGSGTFQVTATSPSTNAGSLPNALLKASSLGSGILANVDYIQRMDTIAGLPPSGPCADNDYRTTVFRATFIFFKNGTNGHAAPDKPHGIPVPPPVKSHDISVPAPYTEIMKVHSVGSYNYICINKKYEFSDSNGDLQALNDRFNPLGTFSFYTTPSGISATINFNAKSPGSGTFEVQATAPSTNEDSLPNALLKASSLGSGVLANVDFIQRRDTLGGLPPSGPCANNDYRTTVFRATFIFFKNPTAAHLKRSSPADNGANLNSHEDL